MHFHLHFIRLKVTKTGSYKRALWPSFLMVKAYRSWQSKLQKDTTISSSKEQYEINHMSKNICILHVSMRNVMILRILLRINNFDKSNVINVLIFFFLISTGKIVITIIIIIIFQHIERLINWHLLEWFQRLNFVFHGKLAWTELKRR